MSARRHIAAQVTLYKKRDINLGTYLKHTKPHQNSLLAPEQHTKTSRNTKETQKKTKKGTVQQVNINR
jgi:hypothetical protein